MPWIPPHIADGLAALLLVASFVLSLIELYRARHQSKIIVAYWRQFVLYFTLNAAGIVVLAASVSGPKPPMQALAGTAWLMAWIFYVTLRLSRFLSAQGIGKDDGTALRHFEKPGVFDAILLIVVVCGAAYYFGCGLFGFCS